MRIGPQRPINPEAIVAPQGYRVEALITGLTFPSAMSFGPGGEIYLAESGGVAGSVIALPRVLRIDPDQSINEIGRLENPIMGLVYRNGELLIGEDGPSPRILRVTTEGEVQVLVEGLPGGGDYGLSGLSLDNSGALLFGLGTRTNSGVVGLDNVARRWVYQHPDWADVPGQDLELAGVNYVTAQPGFGSSARASTGSFKPFGYRCEPGERVKGTYRCGGAIYRLPVEGGDLERVAWGLRNPVGVACARDGRIFATEGGMEERGSRPIAGAPDCLWEIQNNGFFGWPDYAAGVPVTDPRFRLPGHPQPRRLLANSPAVSGNPAATFASRSGVGRLDFSTSDEFGFAGDALVALAGAWSGAAFPGDEGAPTGHRVVRVDTRTGQAVDFLTNRSGGPSSGGNSGGLERPFDVRFDPTGEVLYVLDLGEIHLSREHGLEPYGGTGVLWRITRARASVSVPAPEAQPEPKPEGREPRGRRGDRRGGKSAPAPAPETEEAEELTPVQIAEEHPEGGLADALATQPVETEEAPAEEPGQELTEAPETEEIQQVEDAVPGLSISASTVPEPPAEAAEPEAGESAAEAGEPVADRSEATEEAPAEPEATAQEQA